MKNINGQLGERAAANYLRKKEYKIIAVNFYSNMGEIDIIAEDEQYICFIEVKTRTEGGLLEPKDSVSKIKRKRLESTAKYYLAYNETKLNPRFDIIEVIISDTETFNVISINHIEDAF